MPLPPTFKFNYFLHLLRMMVAPRAADSDEPWLVEGGIRVAVEALAARDPKVTLLDEVLVDVAGVFESLGVLEWFRR
jgi:hypothetical protein